MKKKVYYFLAVLVVPAIFLQSCKKASVENPGTLSNLNGPTVGKASNLATVGIDPLPINDFTCFDGANVVAVSTVPVANGYQLYQNGAAPVTDPPYQSTGWVWKVVPGAGTNITSDWYGNVYMTNALGDIFKRTSDWSSPWMQLPGQASVIRCNNANSSYPFVMYCLGTTMADANGYHIYKWNNNTQNWDTQLGTAVKLAVEPNGTAWCANAAQTIFRSDGNGGWTVMPGLATEIAAGGDSPSAGVVYCIGNVVHDDNGYYIYKWINNNWTPVDGSAVKITVSRSADVLVENNKGQFFEKRSSDTNFSPFLQPLIGPNNP